MTKYFPRLLVLAAACALDLASARELTPREAYNQGAHALAKGYLREAESHLLRAAGSNRAALQPPALYDLGHVRFLQGKDLMKGEQPRKPMIDRADTAREDGEDATREATRALKRDQLEHILGAYMAGRVARKELRLAHEDVQRALNLYGSVLVRWRRSVGDFRSTVELRATDADASFNADAVQRHIDELLKHMKELEQQMEGLGKTRADLKQKMKELRGKIPKGMMQPGEGDPDEDEEEEDQPQPTPESGWQDKGGKEGEERGISPEMAQQILEALGLGGDRKLPMGRGDRGTMGGDKVPPKDRKGKDW